jgi:hypothetical protein
MPKYSTTYHLNAYGIELDEIISDADRPSCVLRPRHPEKGVARRSGIWKVVRRIDDRHVRIRKIQDGEFIGRSREIEARELRRHWILEHPDDLKPAPVREWSIDEIAKIYVDPKEES